RPVLLKELLVFKSVIVGGIQLQRRFGYLPLVERLVEPSRRVNSLNIGGRRKAKSWIEVVGDFKKFRIEIPARFVITAAGVDSMAIAHLTIHSVFVLSERKPWADSFKRTQECALIDEVLVGKTGISAGKRKAWIGLIANVRGGRVVFSSETRGIQQREVHSIVK